MPGETERDRDISASIRPELETMPGYEAIEPPDQLARRLGIPPERIVKLDGNENPYGPSPKALKALAEYRDYHIYPDPLQHEARSALSRFLGVPFEQIVFGTGSDEIMDLVLRAFLRARRRRHQLSADIRDVPVPHACRRRPPHRSAAPRRRLLTRPGGDMGDGKRGKGHLRHLAEQSDRERDLRS